MSSDIYISDGQKPVFVVYVIYIYIFFYSQLNRNKSGHLTADPSKPHRQAIFSRSLIFKKWAKSGHLTIFMTNFISEKDKNIILKISFSRKVTLNPLLKNINDHILS